MTFDELLALVSADNNLRVCIDSRLVKSGDVFVAVKGSTCDGHDFISNAIANRAKYIVSEKPLDHHEVEVVVVEDSSIAAAVLSQAADGNPSSKLTNLAVTGTNGKTTVAFLVHSIIKAAGQKCGLISTIKYDTGLEQIDAPLTTPDCLIVAYVQSKMVKAGCKYMITEASSHALSQNRLAAVNFRAAAFTNLTGDHLDYHKTEENYLSAKSKLFESLSKNSFAVLNKQSSACKEIAKRTKAQIIWYAIDASVELHAHIESMDIDGTVFTLSYKNQAERVKTFLPGNYNISNCLAATGLCLAAGFDLSDIAQGIFTASMVPGRLEKVNWPGNFTVLIDYAHTDDALKNVLSALKSLCKSKLIVVFGCGGDRDTSKRARMAHVVEEFADLIIITSDNSRTEEPEYIIGEIYTGFDDPTSEAITAHINRAEAIEFAIQSANKGDIVLIAGKGHETYQIIGKEKIDFSDKEVALEFLKKLK